MKPQTTELLIIGIVWTVIFAILAFMGLAGSGWL